MAPQNVAQSLLGHKPRPSVVRPIVPAIPLPYMQKRKQNAAAAPKKIADEKIAKPATVTPSTVTPTPTSPIVATTSPKTPTNAEFTSNGAKEQAPAAPAATDTPVIDDTPKDVTQVRQSQEVQEGEHDISDPQILCARLTTIVKI